MHPEPAELEEAAVLTTDRDLVVLSWTGWLGEVLPALEGLTDVDVVRGHEGDAARVYFDAFPGLVRQNRDLSALPQVSEARVAPTASEEAATVTEGLGGGQILAAHARIPSLGWVVVVERPLADAFAPLRAPIVRNHRPSSEPAYSRSRGSVAVGPRHSVHEATRR